MYIIHHNALDFQFTPGFNSSNNPKTKGAVLRRKKQVSPLLGLCLCCFLGKMYMQ